MHACLSYQAV